MGLLGLTCSGRLLNNASSLEQRLGDRSKCVFTIIPNTSFFLLSKEKSILQTLHGAIFAEEDRRQGGCWHLSFLSTLWQSNSCRCYPIALSQRCTSLVELSLASGVSSWPGFAGGSLGQGDLVGHGCNFQLLCIYPMRGTI